MDLMSFTPTAPVPFGNVSREAQVAYDHRAPDDEVSQAGAELMASLAGAIEVNPEAQVAWADYRRLQEAEKTGDRLLMKALSYSHPEAAQAKARTEAVWSILGGGGLYIQKPGLTFDALRAMRQDQPGGRNVQRQPQHRRYQQDGRERGKLQRLLYP